MASCENEEALKKSIHHELEKPTEASVNSDPNTSDLPFYACEFVEKEIGNDFKSLWKVSSLIEKIAEEKKHLEEQVWKGVCSIEQDGVVLMYF